jgi:hypothetical protein
MSFMAALRRLGGAPNRRPAGRFFLFGCWLTRGRLYGDGLCGALGGMTRATEHADVASDAANLVIHLPPGSKRLLAKWDVARERGFVFHRRHRRRGVGRVGPRGFLLSGGKRSERCQYDNGYETFHSILVMDCRAARAQPEI